MGKLDTAEGLQLAVYDNGVMRLVYKEGIRHFSGDHTGWRDLEAQQEVTGEMKELLDTIYLNYQKMGS